MQARKSVGNLLSGTANKENKGQDKVARVSADAMAPSKVPPIAQGSSEGRKSSGKTQPQPAKDAAINGQVLQILKEMNTNVAKQGTQLETLTKRVDDLYEYYDESGAQDVEYVENENYVDPQNQDLPDPDHTDEPSAKRQRLFIGPLQINSTDNGVPDCFSHLSDKFQTTERCDNELNENLAGFINSSFRNGIAEEALTEMLKDIHRPVNCESLVKTKVNGSIWRLLKPQTRTEDVHFQTLQNVVVKSAINMSKLLDKEGENLDNQSLEWGSNALALLGHSFKLINNKRKENHRNDLDPRFFPLTSASLPYTENLYGDDVNKNVKDIQDMSRLGRDVARTSTYRPYGGYNRRRGGRRGPTRGGRGRGFYRPAEVTAPPQGHPKNHRMGPKK